MSHLFPFDLNNNTYDFAKCYNAYDNVEGVSSSKHVPWRSTTLTGNLNSSSTTESCTNSMVKCRTGNLIDNDPYGVITNTNRECAAPPNYKYYNLDLPEIIASFDRSKKSKSNEIKYNNEESNKTNNKKTNDEESDDEESDDEETNDEETNDEETNDEETNDEETNDEESDEDSSLIEQFKEFFRTSKKSSKKGSKKVKKGAKKGSKKVRKSSKKAKKGSKKAKKGSKKAKKSSKKARE
jgi:hypothetical protein